ncbi:MAG: aminopeptidase P family protein [Actinobacteria bacterium]|nr:aminopeptidase P family protein [Actinomycetota bacterium]
MFAARMDRARRRMQELRIDVVLLSVGADLPYLTGYEAMPLERLTMLVLPRDAEAVLVVPRLEAPRVDDRVGGFTLRPWDETEDPVAIVAALASGAQRIAVGDQTWARFVLGLSAALPDTAFLNASDVLSPLRAVKDADEIAALRAAAHAADAVALEMAQERFSGRTERDVSREFAQRLIDLGHSRANFAIVASGPNGASPHHEPGERVIDPGDVVVCDFGGRMRGYCSDITRTYVVGHPTDEFADLFDVLAEAQARAVDAVEPGVPAEEIDAVARRIITDAGYGSYFIHRTGHGIGLDAHEEPYLVAGNDEKLEVGNVFSVEPGIYLPGRYGARIEDIVVVTGEGPESLNLAPHHAYIVD